MSGEFWDTNLRILNFYTLRIQSASRIVSVGTSLRWYIWTVIIPVLAFCISHVLSKFSVTIFSF
jgi:hypothetical protein